MHYQIYKGETYQTSKERTIEYFQQALSIARELRDRSTEANILCQLANRHLPEDEHKAEELY